MHYMILCEDAPGSLETRRRLRPAHLARIQQLLDQGRLVLAGPLPAVDADDPGPAGFSGSLIVAEFADLAAARDWADADPFRVGGVYQRVTVRPLRKTLPT